MGAPARVVWLGHATVLIELDGLRLLTDPLLARWLGPLRRTSAPPPRQVIDHVDVLLLSHFHADHADTVSLRRVNSDALVIAPHGALRWLGRRGFSRIEELAPGDSYEVGPLTITATHADHDGDRHRFGPSGPALGFMIGGSRVIYFAGDTDLFDEMESLHPAIDLALLPVGGWGPTLGPGHMDPRRAAESLRMLKPRVAVPIHWGTLSLPWRSRKSRRTDLRGHDFAKYAAELAPEVEVHVLRPGHALSLDTAGGHGT
jgi:L-ascorbate metabolism protein UlaG (beta-lactamase superfamily)